MDHTVGLTFGQPTPITHPHLLKNGEIVPEVTIEELRDRRTKLIERVLRYGMSLTNQIKNHIVISICIKLFSEAFLTSLTYSLFFRL